MYAYLYDIFKRMERGVYRTLNQKQTVGSGRKTFDKAAQTAVL